VSAPTSGQRAVPSPEQSAFPPARPTAPCFFHLASVALSGPRRRSAAGGSQRPEARPGLLALAARGRFTSATALRTPPALNSSSRAAASQSEQASQSDSFAQRARGAALVGIGATSSPRQESAGLAAPAAVDGERDAQSPPVGGPGAARLANTPALFVVDASRCTGAAGTTVSVRAGAADASTPTAGLPPTLQIESQTLGLLPPPQGPPQGFDSPLPVRGTNPNHTYLQEEVTNS
jgi:hypothetical protein